MQNLYDEENATKDIKDIKEKWKLVPAFLRLRGLTKQHIDSFNYFINVDMQRMVAANNIIRIDNPNFSNYYLRFNRIWIGTPRVDDDFR